MVEIGVVKGAMSEKIRAARYYRFQKMRFSVMMVTNGNVKEDIDSQTPAACP